MTDLPQIAMGSARVRPSPFFEATRRYGARSFTVYNHMYLPVTYESQEAEYEHLVRGVTVWDVSCQRQVEITGPDAARFTQYLVTRDVDLCDVGRARYTMVCDPEGGVLNDPVLLRLAPDHFWLSLADRDILLWARGVAHGADYEVSIREPDVSPLQVQGPKSTDLMRSVFGELVDHIGFYRFVQTELEGVPLVVSRTGWSGELGYEVFLRDGSKGDWLWERLFEAGRPLGVVPAAPNGIRRIEGGLLSYLGDMDESVNPYELGLGWLVDLDTDADFIGKAALARIAREGARRQMVGLRLDGPPRREGNIRHWPVTVDGQEAGTMTAIVWSPRLGTNLALALMAIDQAAPDTRVTVHGPDGDRSAIVSALPFLEPHR